MKFNKISMVLAALAFVGCSSEDLNEFSATQAVEDSNLIQLGSDFVLAGVGADGTTTRTHWEQDATTKKLVNKFLPIYTSSADFTGTLTLADNADLTAQAVGLCWLGNGATGTDVYTNYEFYHYGWLKWGAKTAEFDCGYLTNGALYNEISASDGTAEAEADTTKFALVTPRPGTNAPAWNITVTDLNYNSGVYKTENKAIFGGKYIVYYPYNKDFKDAGTIPAVAKTNWTNVPTDMKSSEVGSETFRYSAPVDIEGGNQAANFSLKNLSALVQLRVAAAKGYAGSTTFDKIVLFSAKKQLLKQANLAADKIAAGNEGTELYTETEGTKTIVATFETPQTLKATDDDVTSAYITALPTTVEDLVVFVHSKSQKKWAKVSLPNTVFKAHSGKRLDIIVADDDFKADFIAVDQASLQQALTDARTLATDADHAQTIQVIGDITLSSNLYITNSKDAFITIKGDDIIVPENTTLSLNTNMESNVRVLGKSCCTGSRGGWLYVNGGTISNVTLEETEASKKNETTNPRLYYYGDATVAAGKTVDVQAGNVYVNAVVSHKGDIKIAKKANVTVNGYGDLNFMGGSVTNNGTIEVKKDGKFNMTTSEGAITATAGKRMTNNGTFIHNIDAQVGAATQSMNQNGVYRCRVNSQNKLNDAFLQWTACSVIEMVEAGTDYNLGTAAGIAPTAYMHNGKYIDIEVNTTSATNFINVYDASTKKGGEEDINIGNLTVKDGGLNIDYIVDDNATDPAKRKYFGRTLIVNGDMTVAANTDMIDSKQININGNLTVQGGATLKYYGPSAADANHKNEKGLAVTKDINVSGATFDASDLDALNITCANFYLTKGATATFGNRTDGAAKTMTVSGVIDNPSGCWFDILAANQVGTSLLGWVTCTELRPGGTFLHAQPLVVE